MAKHVCSPRARCPFYLHESSSMIYCSGVQKENVIHMAFSDLRSAKTYKEGMCKGCYSMCRVFRMLEDIRIDGMEGL